MTTPQRARAALLAGCLALAGCGVGPSYHRPALPIPAAYTSPRAAAGAPRPARPGGAASNAPELNRLIDPGAHPAARTCAPRRPASSRADQAARIAGSPPSAQASPARPAKPGSAQRHGIRGDRHNRNPADRRAGRVTAIPRRASTSAELNASYEVDVLGHEPGRLPRRGRTRPRLAL